MSDPIRYFVMVGDEQRGPFTLEQLQGMWRSGSVTMDSKYWIEGLDEWMPLSSILELFQPQQRAYQAQAYFAPVAQPTWNPGVALVLSFFIPGLGQMYRGEIGRGFLWLIVVPLGYFVFLIPGFIAHIICLVDAYSERTSGKRGR